MAKLNIDHLTTSFDSPMGNDKNVKCHATLKSIVSKINSRQLNQLGISTQPGLSRNVFNVSQSAGQSSYFILFGRDVILPINK